MSKQMMISMACVCMLVMSGCGFALRGTNNSLHIAAQYQNVQVTSDETADAFAVKQPLIKYLQVRGITPTSADNGIHLNNVRFRRYDLVGTLTEVRLVLMADIEYHLNDKKYQYPVQVERSYQYNEASVVADDGQSKQAKIWLYNHLAERIAEQYRALAQSTQ